jgi:two-component system, chemotaxis family, protein-glutamate methylesterase/glutaminase
VKENNKSRIIVIGASAGGLNVIATLLKSLPEDYKIPIIIVQHLSPQSNDFWIKSINELCKFEVKEAEEKELIQKGFVYIAPPNYHLLVEHDKTLSLSVEEKVNFSRPSIDVLFESASDVFKENLIGIIFTGSSKDGASGMKKIKENGGTTIVQDPSTSENKFMPEAAINASKIDHILSLEKIIELLKKLNRD